MPIRAFRRLALKHQALVLGAACLLSVAWAGAAVSQWLDRTVAYASANALAGTGAHGPVAQGGLARPTAVVRLLAEGQVLAGATAALSRHEVAGMEALASGASGTNEVQAPFTATDERQLVLVVPVGHRVASQRQEYVSVAVPHVRHAALADAWAMREAAYLAPVLTATAVLVLSLTWLLWQLREATRLERFARLAMRAADEVVTSPLRLDPEEVTSRNELHRLNAALRAMARAQRMAQSQRPASAEPATIYTRR